jgi:hypothetical protein
MPEQISGQWLEGGSIWESTKKQSLVEFLILTRHYLKKVITSLDSVQYTYELLNGETRVWPDQCDYAVISVSELREPVHDFWTMLEKTSQIPDTIIPLRYQLATELIYLDDQIRKLILMIGSFRSSCQATSKEAIRQRSAILHKLETLLESKEDIAQRSERLFEQAIKQEQGLLT